MRDVYYYQSNIMAVFNPIPDELIAENIKDWVEIYWVPWTYNPKTLVGNIALYCWQAGANAWDNPIPADQTYRIAYFDWGTKFYVVSLTVLSRNDWAQINSKLLLYWTITSGKVEVVWYTVEMDSFNTIWLIWPWPVVYLSWGIYYLRTNRRIWRDWTQMQFDSTFPSGSQVTATTSVTIDWIVYGDIIRRLSKTFDGDDRDTYYSDMHMLQVTLL